MRGGRLMPRYNPMTDVWIAPEQVFDGQRLGRWGLRVRDGLVVETGVAPVDAWQVPGLVTPGFVDLQVNGGGGVLVNTTPTPDGIKTIAAAHRNTGTVAILPTVITDAPGVMEQAAKAVLAMRDDPAIMGLHIEGPHIAAARRGTHAATQVRAFESSTLSVVAKLRASEVPVMITVAPEAVTDDQIAALVYLGAVVSLGHTDADADQTRAALNAGATCFTHLFNAMSPMLNRSPGAVGAAIGSAAYAGIICDGVHVDDTMVGIAIRARPEPDRMFLVSDAMPTVGGPSEFNLYGKRIHLENGRLINDEGSLAGAHVTQAMGVARLVQKIGISLEEALRMAITVPAQVMGAGALATLTGRRTQDILVLDKHLHVTGTLATLSADAVAL